MHVISLKKLRNFWREHADTEKALAQWFADVEDGEYTTPHELRQAFGSVDFLGQGRVVFNIKGNKYRLVADIRYDTGTVYVRHVLTHKDYDRRTREGTL